MLEVCVDSFESALLAINNGAEELEVCSSLPLGGLTPTAGLVNQVKLEIEHYVAAMTTGTTDQVVIPKINIMIRCRAGSDFCYNALELDTMLEDIKVFKKMGVDRFVFGCLTDTQEIDSEQCSKIIALAHPKPVTFHRAFDVCKQPMIAIKEIIDLGFDRLLTSGRRACAADDDALAVIKTLLLNWGHKIQIMPGAGINAKNVKTFIDLGCKIVHSSCKMVRPFIKVENSSCMEPTDNAQSIYVVDAKTIQELRMKLTEKT